MQELEKALEILNKLSFFGGQRAGRELWNEKPREVQDEDIASFDRDIEYLRDFIRKYMNDGWIPVEERLPEKFSIGVEVTTKDLERNIARYAKPPMDMWISVYTGRTLDVIAWKEPSESYHPEGLETRKNSKGARENERD